MLPCIGQSAKKLKVDRAGGTKSLWFSFELLFNLIGRHCVQVLCCLPRMFFFSSFQRTFLTQKHVFFGNLHSNQTIIPIIKTKLMRRNISNLLIQFNSDPITMIIIVSNYLHKQQFLRPGSLPQPTQRKLWVTLQ